jgi:hypothetical protein
VRNHNEKIKDMAESVLPSKRRRGARFERRHIHAQERARIRAELHAYRTAIDPDDIETDLRIDGRHAIARMVSDRRDADKVAPLVRWAIRRVELDPDLRGASVEDQIASFRRVLPDNLIGRHAVSHIEGALEWEYQRRRAPRTGIPRTLDGKRAEWRALVMRVLESGQHAKLNSAMWRQVERERNQRERQALAERRGKQAVRYLSLSTPWRPLLGIHDVDDYVGAVMPVASVRAIVESLAASTRNVPPWRS